MKKIIILMLTISFTNSIKSSVHLDFNSRILKYARPTTKLIGGIYLSKDACNKFREYSSDNAGLKSSPLYIAPAMYFGGYLILHSLKQYSQFLAGDICDTFTDNHPIKAHIIKFLARCGIKIVKHEIIATKK